MSAERIAHVDLVIDADGLARTGHALQTMERGLDKIQRRAERLGRLRITPIIRLNDCLCEPIRRIRAKLTELVKTVWTVSVRAKFELDRKLLDKLEASVKVAVETDIKVNVAATAAASAAATASAGGKGDGGKDQPWWQKLLDYAKSFLSDVLDVYKDRLKDLVVGMIDKVIAKLAGVKGLGFLKALLPDEKNDAVKCICQCMCGGAGGGSNGRRSKRSSGRRGNRGRGNANGRGNGRERGRSRASEGRLARTARRVLRTGGSVAKKVASFGGKALRGAGGIAKGLLKGGLRAAPAALLGLAGSGLGGKALNLAKKLPLKSIGKGLLNGAGKLVRPLGLAMDVADIAAAKPGEERSRAIGRAVGGSAGAIALGAVGTAILPGIGTAIGTTLGGMAGEWVGDKIGGAVSKIKKVWPFGRKDKDAKPSVETKAPAEAPAPTRDAASTSAAVSAAVSASVTAKASVSPLNVNIPTGAVQLTVQNPDVDYDAIAAEIGARMSASIKQTIENRAS